MSQIEISAPPSRALMTARQIIEARLGKTLPPTRELPDDLKVAVRELGKQLVKSRRAKK